MSAKPEPKLSSEKLQQAAFASASSALVAHSGGFAPGGASGKGPGAEVELDDLFSLRRPKNVFSGASSGLQSIAKGVLQDHPQFARLLDLLVAHFERIAPQRPPGE